MPTYPSQLIAEEADGDVWSDDLQENVAVEAEREALRDAMTTGLAPRVIPLGRVLAAACFVPILAMIVLGASRFDDLPAIGVGALAETAAAPEEDGAQSPAFATGNYASQEVHLAQLLEETVPAGVDGVLYFESTEMMEVTAYCPCEKCCGKNARGITASGKPVSYNGGRFVAADTRVLPFGSMLRIPQYHGEAIVEVIDRGGAIKGNKIDVFFTSHAEARKWGRQRLPVKVLRPVEPGGRTGEPLN